MQDADPEIWKASWGVQPNKVLSPIRLPSAEVILEALTLYQSEFRKPSLTVFCLDFSGSMEGEGEWQLENAMKVLLDEESSRRFLIQVGRRDKTIILPFDGVVRNGAVLEGNDPASLQELSVRIGTEAPTGKTDIYGAAIRGLELIEQEEYEDYVPAVILMTDGLSNTGHDFRDLERKWKSSRLDVPIFCILFGDASEEQLGEIVDLTRGGSSTGDRGSDSGIPHGQGIQLGLGVMAASRNLGYTAAGLVAGIVFLVFLVECAFRCSFPSRRAPRRSSPRSSSSFPGRRRGWPLPFMKFRPRRSLVSSPRARKR
ncbi:MAG: vWA domain-containing protein [Candidatus Eisenbacteria bacterium]